MRFLLEILIGNDKNASRKAPAETEAQVVLGEDLWLADLEPADSEGLYAQQSYSREFITGNTGEEYRHYLYAGSLVNGGSGKGWAEYELEGKYERITGWLAVEQEYYNTNLSAQVSISADGLVIYESQTITAGSPPVYFDVNINHCNLLKIDHVGGDPFVLGEIRLYAEAENAPEPDTIQPTTVQQEGFCWLSEMHPINSQNMYWQESYSPDLITSNTGADFSHYLYAGSMYNGGTGEGWIEYYLQGTYSRITGYLVIDQEWYDTEHTAQVTIYAGGERVYQSDEMRAGDTPVYFDVNIYNCTRLRIEHVGGDPFVLGEVKVYP